MKRTIVWVALVSAVAFGLGAWCAGPAAADEERVVVSRPGTVFHKPDSEHLRGRAHEKALSSALAGGYTPCHICYAGGARSARTPAGSPAGAAGFSVEGVGTYVITLSSGSLETPFGLKQGIGERASSGRVGIDDPYDDLRTVLNPGAEQGAYGSCQSCSPGKSP
jgi:hypothetical protein